VSRRILFRPQAEVEALDAWAWYAERQLETARRFTLELNRCIDRIQATPEMCPLVDPPLRRALLRHFPYAVFYRVSDDEIVIVSCFHVRRNPKVWRQRR